MGLYYELNERLEAARNEIKELGEDIDDLWERIKILEFSVGEKSERGETSLEEVERMVEFYIKQGYKRPGELQRKVGISWEKLYAALYDLMAKKPNKGYSIFILVRTNKQVLKLGKELILSGVHFDHLKVDYRSIWEMGSKEWGTFRELVYALLKVRNGEELDIYDLVTLLYYSKFIDWHLREGLTEKERYKLIAQQMEKIIGGLEKGQLSLDLLKVKKNPFDVLDLEKVKSLNPKFGETAVNLIKELMKEKTNLVSIPKDAKIYLDTIHASKGREADVVFLINDLPKKWSSILKTPEELDAERRVWYVGLTRAKEKVYVLNGKHPFPIY